MSPNQLVVVDTIQGTRSREPGGGGSDFISTIEGVGYRKIANRPKYPFGGVDSRFALYPAEYYAFERA